MAETTIPTKPVNGTVENRREETYEPERYIAPAVDIFEKDHGLVVVADLPGLDTDGLAVSVEDSILTIKGTVRQAVERDYVYREFEPVAFFRQFTLGNKIDQRGIGADYKNGVLTVTLPFAEETKPRTIKVNAA